MMRETILALSNQRYYVGTELDILKKFMSANQENIHFFQRTNELESDTKYIQPIPYVILVNGFDVLCYKRSDKNGDERLRGGISVGFGGHVNDHDIVLGGRMKSHIDLKGSIKRAAKREIFEETGVTIDPDKLFLVKILHNIDTPVNAVHLGLVFLCQVNNEKFDFNPDEITSYWWSNIVDATKSGKHMESWSNLAIHHIYANNLLSTYQIALEGM